jgi:hypothetical protein
MREQHQDFDDVFKMGFEDFAPTPAPRLWDNIERELPLADEDIFRSSFENYEVEPSPVVWQNVKRRLPINLVVRRHLTMLSRIAAVLLLGMFGLMTYDQFQPSTTTDGYYGPTAEGTTLKGRTTNEKIVSATDVVTSEVTPKQTNIANQSLAYVTTPANTQNNVVFVQQTNAEKTAALTSENNNSIVTKGRNAEKANDTNAGTEILNKTIQPLAQVVTDLNELEGVFVNSRKSLPSLADVPLPTNAFNGNIQRRGVYADIAIDMHPNDAKSVFNLNTIIGKRGFYVTVNAQGDLSRIFNENIVEQVGTGATNDNGLQSSFGVSGGYRFTNQFALELGTNVSNIRQRYREIDGGEKFTTASLQYVNVPLTGKLRFKDLNRQQPTSVSLVGGVQYSRLTQSPTLKTTLNGEPIDNPTISDNSFVKNGLGLVAGADVDIKMNDKMSFTVGGRANYSKDIQQMFAKGSSQNVQFGARVGMNYSLAR